MQVTPTSLPGVLIVEPNIFTDKRGFFMEIYHLRRYTEFGMEPVFVQDNMSYSVQGTLRALHYQLPYAQAKLVQVITGTIFDVAVDIRRTSPTFGQWVGVHLSDENRHQLFIPEGFAHGLCVLSETAYVLYKCTDFYAPDAERGILWSDPALGIDWPVKDPLISPRDSQFPLLRDVSAEFLPVFREKRL